MEWGPSHHLGVVAIEKGSFGSPSTKVANFIYLTRACETFSLLAWFIDLNGIPNYLGYFILILIIPFG